MILSVIIPVYNTSKYLHRCLDSILNQNFTDFELILINDGSTDDSLKILREYEAKDRRIIVIDKPNEGVSAARNHGIEIAKGEYIMFCDSDDHVAENWCETLLSFTQKNPDCLCCSAYYRVSSNQIIPKTLNTDKENITVCQCFINGLFSGLWNKIYRISVIKENDIKFTVGFPNGEDVEFICKYLKYCQGLKYVAEPTYFYIDSETSALKKYYHDLLYYHLRCFDFRLPFISNDEVQEYCDFSFGYIFPMFHNVFDKRNHESWFKKMQFNQNMIQTDSFAFMINHISDQAIDARSKRILKKQNYYLYYFFSKLAHIKNKITRRRSK